MRFVIALFVVACAATPPRSTPVKSDHAELVRTLFQTFNNGDTGRLAQIVAPDFTSGGPVTGPAAFTQVMTGLRGAFPDLIYTVEDLVADGDRVAVRWTWRGTHTAPFRKHAATGKRVANTGTAIFQIANGKIARGWLETDRLGFLEQIDALHYEP